MFTRADLALNDDQLGDGYGAATSAAIGAIELAARREGIVFDPLYSGKDWPASSSTQARPTAQWCSGTPAARKPCSRAVLRTDCCKSPAVAIVALAERSRSRYAKATTRMPFALSRCHRASAIDHRNLQGFLAAG